MEDLFREIFVEAAAPTTNDETTVVGGLEASAANVGDALWRASDAPQTQVVADVAGDGKAVVGEEGRVAEGPIRVGESAERESENELVLGAKRKRGKRKE